MAYSSSTLSQREGTTERHTPLLQEDPFPTERRWEKLLDDPILRRLLRDGHRTGTRTDLLMPLEEDT